MTVFTVANTSALKSNRIRALHETHDGTLWIAHIAPDIIEPAGMSIVNVMS